MRTITGTAIRATTRGAASPAKFWALARTSPEAERVVLTACWPGASGSELTILPGRANGLLNEKPIRVFLAAVLVASAVRSAAAQSMTPDCLVFRDVSGAAYDPARTAQLLGQ